MRSSIIPTLTEIEEEIISLLIDVGLKKDEARLLMVFFRGLEQTSRDLERICELRQPEVSNAIMSLTKRNWIFISCLNTGHVGRPENIYALKKTPDAILDEIKDGISAGHEQQVMMIRKIIEIIRG